MENHYATQPSSFSLMRAGDGPKVRAKQEPGAAGAAAATERRAPLGVLDGNEMNARRASSSSFNLPPMGNMFKKPTKQEEERKQKELQDIFKHLALNPVKMKQAVVAPPPPPPPSTERENRIAAAPVKKPTTGAMGIPPVPVRHGPLPAPMRTPSARPVPPHPPKPEQTIRKIASQPIPPSFYTPSSSMMSNNNPSRVSDRPVKPQILPSPIHESRRELSAVDESKQTETTKEEAVVMVAEQDHENENDEQDSMLREYYESREKTSASSSASYLSKTTRETIRRARQLQKSGNTASALALFKEAAQTTDLDGRIATEIAKLRAQLVSSSAANANESRAASLLFGSPALPSSNTPTPPPPSSNVDPLEALFQSSSSSSSSTGPQSTKETSASAVPSSSSAWGQRLQAEQEESPRTVRRNDTISGCVYRMEKMGEAMLTSQSAAAWELCRLLASWETSANVVMGEGDGSPSAVRFFPLGSVQPPPANLLVGPGETPTEALDRALSSTDDAISFITTALAFAKKRSNVRSAGEMADFFAPFSSRTGLGKYRSFAFLRCQVTKLLVPEGKCACGGRSLGECRVGAFSGKDRLGELVGSALRCCMRYALNPSHRIVLGTGSYTANGDDVAAAVHRALLIYDAHRTYVETVVLGLSASSSGTSSSLSELYERRARLGEFIEAHGFLSKLFPHANANGGGGPTSPPENPLQTACWTRMTRYLALVREYKLEDEGVLAPLGAIPRFAKTLAAAGELVSAARAQYEATVRRLKTAEPPNKGECSCEGARRRREAASGAWFAPVLARPGEGRNAARDCRECARGVPESGTGAVKCACCEGCFHLECVGLADAGALFGDFVCKCCTVNGGKSTRASQKEEEEEEE